MPIRLSYINARGDEAVLDDDEGSFAHELAGREGMEFPTIKLAEHEYSDGTTDIVAITVKNRSVTLYFWADVMDIPHWEDKFDEVKAILLQTGQKENEWGKLKIRLKDGHYVYLNCVYEKGLDTIVRDNNTRVKFSLTFKATDPYFYNGFDYSYTVQQNDRDGYLMFNDALIVDSVARAQEITGQQSQGVLWWSLGGSKYYAIDPSTTLFMDEAKIFDTRTEAMNETAETEPGNYWEPITTDGVTKYYAVLPATTLFMRTAAANTQDELYIQCEKVYPDIVINGPAENIILANGTTGKKIQLSPTIKLALNQQIHICTTPRKRSIKRGSTNLIPYLTEDSTLDFWLAHGTNALSFNNTAMTPETYLRFTYTERRSSIQ
ncbi:MAG: hypothetical protein IJI57_04145 [Flexilinea sp.]|nr:hypothetical protein [Flexilinea sp.]